ncbi:hypothetical protein [Spirosoma sp.]|uniref:hypothetical protein n=1 Tax=Spirosoma sp. TaxID=1899569 RepID=UPI0026106EE1|nr:hypothetical protein [Spirosoma sp.]MCX6216523.1 hypothetical protein [Spirosoma sp.]
MTNSVTNLLIDCPNPDAFNKTVQALGAAALVENGNLGYLMLNGYYVLQVYNNVGWIRFAIEQQGYGKVIGEAAL